MRGRWCTDAKPEQALQPSFTPNVAEGRRRVRPPCPWSCAHVRVPWTQAGGRTERRYCNPSTLIGWRQLLNSWANPGYNPNPNPSRGLQPGSIFQPWVTTQVDIPAVGYNPGRYSSRGLQPVLVFQPWVTTRVGISAVGWVGGPTRVGFDPLVTTLGGASHNIPSKCRTFSS